MNSVTIALRIPGQWAHPKELIERLPKGCRFTAESLILPDETEIGFGAMDADDQFAQIFRGSCRQPATDDEYQAVDNYKVNVFLSGPGGSLDAARTMMRAGVMLIQAGGAGVFNDNSGLAHGGQNWIAMTEDGTPDAISFAFVSIVSGKADVWTMGMHVLGLREIIMRRPDCDRFDITDVIRYMAASEKPIENGHVIADLDGPKFQVVTQDSGEQFKGSPMYNPFGKLKLVSVQEITESN